MTHFEIVLVSCTDTKRDGKHKARELYEVSAYFRKQRRYARTADAWYIQSAKHGLVNPDSRLSAYNQHAGDLADPEMWGERIAASLAGRHDTPATVYLLGGINYTQPTIPALERRGFDAVAPLHGLGIGERMAKLDRMAAPGTQTNVGEWK